MEPTAVIVSALGVLEVIICAACFFMRHRWQMVLCVLLYNVTATIQYFLQGYLTETLITATDIVLDGVLLVMAFRDMKPSLVVILLFETIVITLSIMTWENWFSIFALMASVLCIFSYWQRSTTGIRIVGLIVSALAIFSYIFTGIYMNIIAESISFLSAFISLVVYHFKNSRKTQDDQMEKANVDNGSEKV